MFWQPDCDPLSVEMGIYSLLEAERFDRCFLLQFTYVSETVPCHVTQEAVGSSPVPPTTSYPNSAVYASRVEQSRYLFSVKNPPLCSLPLLCRARLLKMQVQPRSSLETRRLT